MNKIYKVMYSKVKQCAVVVSEIAKSHGRHTKSSVAKSSAALTAGVLIALGSFSFVGMPVAQAADGTESLKNNDYVGANGYYWYFDEKTNQWTKYPYKISSLNNNRSWKELPNYEGGGAKEPGAVTAGLYAQAGEQTVTIGNRNAGQSKGSVFIGELDGYNDGGKNDPVGMKNNYVTAVGFQSNATGWGSIAIGSNAVAENTRETSQVVDYDGNKGTSGTVQDDNYGIKLNPPITWSSVALGYNAKAKDGNIAIGAYSDATSTEKGDSYVSVGNGTLKRRITNVANGTDNSDVVTVGQMNVAIKQADNLNVNAGWGINVADENDPTNTGKGTKNVISLKHNLGTGYNDDEAKGMIIGGLVEDRDPAKQYGAADANSVIVGAGKALASGKSSVVVGGLDNVASGATSVVVGGDNNNAAGNQSAVFGGRDNTAAGIASTAGGGIMNVANGQQAVALGGAYNYALGTSSTAIGGTGGNGMYGYSTSVNGNYSVSLAGGSTGTDALNGLAAGNQSVVTTANGTAVGYQATTDQEGTIAFGHDAGDVSGYAVTWKQRTDGKTNADHTTNDYTQVPASVTPTTYTDAYYNRLVKVADGQDDHDVVVMEQLKQYAEKNASNLGNNIKVYKTDGKGNVQLDKDKNPVEDTGATTTAQKNSKDDWGKALGAGTLTAATAKDSDQLVTGKTLYDYDKPTGSTNYVNANNTTGQNLSALDAQVKSNAKTLNDKTHNIKYYSVTKGFKLGDYRTNENNDGATDAALAGMAAGYETGTTGIASTVAGSYSGVIGSDLQGAAAVSVGTVNVNKNTNPNKAFSGVANSIVGQANMTTDSNAAIIVGAGNSVTNSYRDLDTTTDTLSNIKRAVASKDANALKKALQDAVPKSGGQVMVMGGGNNVESAYMSQVVGVGNTVKGNQVESKGEWVTDTSNTAIKYDPEKSSQYNYVDGFSNEVINGKHDYVIGANNKLSGDSYDDDQANPIKRSNKSNVVIGDNHALTGKKNNVIIGSADTEGTLTRASDAVIIGHNANATSDTGADNAVAIGLSAKAGGGNAVTIGVNTSAGDNSITIGSESSAISGSNIAIGRHARVYGDKVTKAVALGHMAEAHVADGVAIGSGSIATVKGNSVKGYDPTTGQTSTDTTATWQATNAAVSIGTADGKVTRQINGVAAGTNDTDAVNVAQIKKLASINASNIGANLQYGADGTTAVTDTDKTKNKEAWATAIGTGTVTKDDDGSKQMVTGKTVYDALHGGLDNITVGKDGQNGKDGSIGIAGQNGKDGYSITYIKTEQGAAGVDGKDGITRVVYQDKDGNGKHTFATLDDGLKFKGDDSTVIAKKLNEQLNITGGADSTNLTNKNIGVNSSTDGLKIQLAKNLAGITSIANQTTTGKGDAQTTTGAKIDLKDDGSISVNSGKITDVKSGLTATDGTYADTDKNNAANIGDVHSMIEKEAGNTDDKLALKANVAADNIGTHITDTTAQKTNLDNWGAAIGTGAVADSTNEHANQLVTGKTVYDALHGGLDNITVGKDGQNGKDGSIGIAGQNGKDGYSITYIKTEQGAAGVDGKDGITRVVYQDKDGNGKHTFATLDDGLKFKGDDSTVIAKKLNEQLNITGGADSTNLTNKNIGVNSSTDGLKIQLAKNLTSITSISGSTDTNGAKITLDENDKNISVNGGSIKDVASNLTKDGKIINGSDNNAASISDVQTLVQQGVDNGYTHGDGITIQKDGTSGKNVISVNQGDGLKFDSGKLAVNTGDGLTVDETTKALKIKTSDSNLKVDKNGIGLNNVITIGTAGTHAHPITIDGTKGEVSGLNNTSWDSTANYSNSTKAATESQVAAAVKDAIKQAGDNDTHVEAGSYAVDNQHQISMNLVDNNNNNKGTVTITDVAKASEMGDVSQLNEGVQNADGNTTTVVDAINNVNENVNSVDRKVGDLNYFEQNDGKTHTVTNGTSITKAIGDLDSAVQNATEQAGKHTIVSTKDTNLDVKNIAKDGEAANYQIALNQDLNVNTVTAKTVTTDNLTVNKSATIGGVTIANKTISGLDDTKIEKDSPNATNAVNERTIYNELRPTSDGSYIKQTNTTAQNLTSLDTQVRATHDLINSDGKTIKIGGSDAATKIDVNGKDGKGRVITGVVSDANDPNSAANVGYVNGLTAANTQQIYRDMNNAYGRLNNNINKAAAGSNALAALHPLDYDPDDKADFAVGYGHYRNANAAAVGAFYHPNENTMVNVGVSLGNGDPGFNAGVSFKVGRGGAGREAMSKTEMAKVINSQSKEIDALKKDNADKDKRIDALEQKMAEILAKLDKNGK